MASIDPLYFGFPEVYAQQSYCLTFGQNMIILHTHFQCVNKFAQHLYFLANLKYATKLLKHMSHGYIHTCPL
jgi:hypothetical protein